MLGETSTFFLVKTREFGFLLWPSKELHQVMGSHCRVDAEAKKMSTRGVSSGLPIGGAIYSNGHRLQADRIGGSAVMPVGNTSLCLAAHTTWWCLLHSSSALGLFGGWVAGTCQCHHVSVGLVTVMFGFSAHFMGFSPPKE